MPGERPQLYKIRRLTRGFGVGAGSHYEWLAKLPTDDNFEWAELEMDGYAFVNQPVAVKVCERIKVRQRDPQAIFHAVVPA